MKKKIIIIILILVAILAGAILIKNISSDKKNTEQGENIQNIQDISYEYSLDQEGKFILKLKNNSDANIHDIQIVVEYYSEGKKIGEMPEVVCMLEANKEYVVGMPSLIYEEELINDENIKVIIKNKEDVSYQVDNSKVEITKDENNGTIKLEAKNNSSENIELRANIVFYKNDKIVYLKDWLEILEPNVAKSNEIEQLYDVWGSMIEYDRYEVFYNAVIM